jgi:hypothetical protein
VLIISATVTACSGSGDVIDNGGVAPAISPTPITIDNAGVIPVFGNSSTSTVVYVHNNSNTTISEIISTTNGAGIFTFNTNNPIAFPQPGLTDGRVWTGFATGAWYISYGTICNNWTSSSDSGAFGLIGIDDLGGFQIAVDTMLCSEKQDSNSSVNGLYCVQQL